VHSSPALGPDGRVYVGSSDQRVYAIDASAAKVWEYLTEGKVISLPAIGADGMVYVGSGDGNIYAVKLELRGAPASAPCPGPCSTTTAVTPAAWTRSQQQGIGDNTAL